MSAARDAVRQAVDAYGDRIAPPERDQLVKLLAPSYEEISDPETIVDLVALRLNKPEFQKFFAPAPALTPAERTVASLRDSVGRFTTRNRLG